MTEQDTVICPGDSLFVAGAWQTEEGLYSDSLLTATGCDSIVVTSLAYLPLPVSEQFLSICPGDSLWLAGAWQSEAGDYIDTLSSHNGCDSLLTTNLVLLDVLTGTAEVSICGGDSLFVGGAFQSEAGDYIDTLVAVNGCDSVLTSSVTVLETVSHIESYGMCSGDSLLIAGVYQRLTVAILVLRFICSRRGWWCK